MPDPFEHSAFPDVDRYLLKLLPARDGVLERMERYAVERGFPFIGPLVGELLSLLTRASNARTVFEMGSGFGYSALHFARALPSDGQVICTDGDAANRDLAQKYFREAGVAEKMVFHVGDAVAILKEQTDSFDIILMDIDKEHYAEGFLTAWPRLRKGGLFIADNLIWHGRVMTDDDQPSTRAIRDFSRFLYRTPGAQTTIVPLRDGVSITLKTH